MKHILTDQIENLRAFTRLFGYVRFFHPSDEAAGTDWLRFAALGVARVIDAERPEALRDCLEDLFLPLAPGARIYGSEDPLPLDGQPENEDGVWTVWQHKGVELEHSEGMYRSVRLNRPRMRQPSEWGRISQEVSVRPLRGREIRLRCEVELGPQNETLRLATKATRVQLETAEDHVEFRGSGVHTMELLVVVPHDTIKLEIMGVLVGDGSVRFRAFELAVRTDDGWSTVELDRAGFEDEEIGWAPECWPASGVGYNVEVCEHAGGRVVLLESIPPEPLFDAQPKPGEVLYLPLGHGLSVRLPISVEIVGDRTVPASDSARLEELRAALQTVDISAIARTELPVRLAAVVVAWTTLQHFYPYFDVVDADWDDALTTAIKAVSAADTHPEFEAALYKMLVPLADGHMRLHYSTRTWPGPLSLRFELVEDEIVVVAVGEDTDAQVGDVLERVDDVPALDAFQKARSVISGSPQRRDLRALASLGEGKWYSEATLHLRREALKLEAKAKRNGNWSLSEKRPEPISELRPGTHYVNLCQTEIADIQPHLDTLAAAAKVIIDVRGYPCRFSERLLGHLTDTPLECGQWLVPQSIYPDRERLVGFDEGGRWTVQPAEPRFRGEIVFLTDASAISYGESVMGIVEHYRLGTIIGAPTAGTNGNVNHCPLPGEGVLVFTGMKVLKHDGSQLHLLGVQPDILVKRTLAGIRQGQDEVLERALRNHS